MSNLENDRIIKIFEQDLKEVQLLDSPAEAFGAFFKNKSVLITNLKDKKQAKDSQNYYTLKITKDHIQYTKKQPTQTEVINYDLEKKEITLNDIKMEPSFINEFNVIIKRIYHDITKGQAQAFTKGIEDERETES